MEISDGEETEKGKHCRKLNKKQTFWDRGQKQRGKTKRKTKEPRTKKKKKQYEIYSLYGILDAGSQQN